MKQNPDTRVTLDISLRDTVIIFSALVVVSGFHMLIFKTIGDVAPGESPMFLINALMGWIIFSALLLTVLYGVMRHFSYDIPTRKLSDAAKKIADGDFSVKLKITERKNGKKNSFDVLFEDFNTMAEELSSIESMKNDFIASVSHEIKTPISIIQNYSSALLDESLIPTERIEYIKTVFDASERLSNLVTNILKLNKLEHEAIIPAAAPYNICEQLRRCAIGFESLLESKNITFFADIPDTETIACDKTMLEIVWNNLLSNAIKFTDVGGRIELALTAKDGYAQVFVRDTGCGMDEKTVKRIFDKFYQGDSSHSAEGNGLGLAMVKKVLELTGGKIGVESAVGEGSAFTVLLPLAH